MILRSLVPLLLGALVVGCAAGQIAAPPGGPVAPGPDPHEGLAAEGPEPASAGAAGAPTEARSAAVSSAAPPPAGSAPPIDFATQVRPILEAGCRPCHFEGGQMYDRLPFDRPATIRALGTQLFTRIRKEADRALIRDFLDQPGAAPVSD